MVTATHRWHVGPRALAALLAIGLYTGDVFAQSKKKAAQAEAAPKSDPAANQRAYAAGARAFESGDMAGAERQLTVALSGGGLPNAQMAKALYMRGSAYRQQGRPAQAISDLTTAVWLKGGLSEAEKAKALEARQAAYREAGLGETAPPVGPSQSTTAAGATPAGPTPGALVAEVGTGSFWNGISMPSMSLPSIPNPFASSPQTAAAPQAAPAPAAGLAPGAQAPAGGGQVVAGFAPDAAQPAAAPSAPASTWDTQTAAAAAPAASQQPVQVASNDAYVPPAPAGVSAIPTANAEPASATGAGTGIGGFFSNIFGGGGNAAPAGGAPAVTTGSTAPAPEWGAETTVTAQTSSMVQRSPESPPAAAATPQPDSLPWTAQGGPSSQPAVQTAAVARSAGRYKLQVAAVRSREEADKLAQSLAAYPAVQQGIVSAEVDEAVIGNMGTFYRVRLGPYANASEPGQLCQTLKPQGFDCLVVTQ